MFLRAVCETFTHIPLVVLYNILLFVLVAGPPTDSPKTGSNNDCKGEII
jgi:hypothetical protein